MSDEMIERVARAICKANDNEPDALSWTGGVPWKLYKRDARAAIEAMREPTAAMIAAALPIAKMDHDAKDKKLGAAACLLLSGGKNIPREGEAVSSAAGLIEDWRAMIDEAKK